MTMDGPSDSLSWGWPRIASVVSRLEDLKSGFLPLRGFSAGCLRGNPDSESLFLLYSHDLVESWDPRGGGAGTAAQPPAARSAVEGPRALGRTFGLHGIRLEMRFDRGAARRRFPGLSVCDFGDSQISLLTLDGPPTPAFRQLEEAIWGVLYEEAVRFERECSRTPPLL